MEDGDDIATTDIKVSHLMSHLYRFQLDFLTEIKPQSYNSICYTIFFSIFFKIFKHITRMNYASDNIVSSERRSDPQEKCLQRILRISVSVTRNVVNTEGGTPYVYKTDSQMVSIGLNLLSSVAYFSPVVRGCDGSPKGSREREDFQLVRQRSH